MKVKIVIVSFIVSLVTIGCDGKDSVSSVDPILGSWIITTTSINNQQDCNGDWEDADIGMDLSCSGYMFNENGTFDFLCDEGGGDWSISNEGEYILTLEGNQILLGSIVSDELIIEGIMSENNTTICAQIILESGTVDCGNCSEDNNGGGNIDFDIPECATPCFLDLYLTGINLDEEPSGEDLVVLCDWIDNQSNSTCDDSCSQSDIDNWNLLLSFMELTYCMEK